jgi:hypothetical protein
MKRSMNPRLVGAALIGAAAALTFSLSACEIVPAPVPGQPMTAQQQAEANREAQQDMHDRRRQDRPCGPNDCNNR